MKMKFKHSMRSKKAKLKVIQSDEMNILESYLAEWFMDEFRKSVKKCIASLYGNN